MHKANDKAVAGAIGLVLMLAVVVSAYASAVRSNIPVYGEESEKSWHDSVSLAFQLMRRSVSEGLESGRAVTTAVPMPPAPRTVDIPMIGSAAPLPPSGTLTFRPSCASVTADHTLQSGFVITDLDGGPSGCVVFQSTPVYSRGLGYTYELGGILRLEGGRSVVLEGPPLELGIANPSEYRVSLTLPGLRGTAVGVSTDASDAHVDVIPGPAAPEGEQEANAAKITWVIDTPHPGAWKTWFASRLSQAGFVAARASPGSGESAADYTLTCDPVDCSTPGGIGRLTVLIEGPRTDAADLRLALSYGIADVNIR